MKKLFCSFAVLTALAITGTARAQFFPGVTLEYQSVDALSVAALDQTVYLGIAGPYAAFAPASGVLGFDDYDSIAPTPTFNLTRFQFVGGVRFSGNVAPLNRALQFEFYDSGANLINTFVVAFPTSGDFIWTITFGTLLSVPSDGFVQARTLGNSTGRWFLTTSPPVVGSNNFSVGGFGGIYNHAFGMVASVPEPGPIALLMSIATLGIGLAARRRR
ncbi:MAG: PEP-CTERM sorting domain-containing protein [Chloroherpetonaceae bacterium]|nr:PEP-CTERM sorting domain-containing protein [Chloroherpetonaceae bacterium]